jgi:DNA-binding winged helix-turn-helix (wHTH) protein
MESWTSTCSYTLQRRQNRRPIIKVEECTMTKELAILLLTSKDVYLTPEGEKLLKMLVKQKTHISKNRTSRRET